MRKYGFDTDLSARSRIGLISFLMLAFAMSQIAFAQSGDITVLNPRGVIPDVQLTPLAERLDDLNGRTIYLVTPQQNGSRVEESFELVEESLRRRFPDVSIITKYKETAYSQDDPDLWEQLTDEADAFVYGAAPSASSTDWAVNWSGGLERRGLPGVVIVYEALLEVVTNSVANRGVPVRYVPVTYPPGDMDQRSAETAMDAVVSALTRPLSGAERRTGAVRPPRPERSSEHSSVDAVNDYFHSQGWTDGLPIIPPTEARVAAMLAGTTHTPDEIVSEQMWPEEWTATVENVAINAVMAGARPEYMPVLLAMAEAWGNSNGKSTVQSTNSFAYMAVVNGPVRREIGMNSGTYALGPGNQANATIGRALRLFIMNLGGGRPGMNMMGTQGNPAMYSMAIAENEEASPWESLAVQRGYRSDESTVSIFSGGWSKVGNYLNGNLDRLIEGVRYFEYPLGLVVMMSPLAAARQAQNGLSKEDVHEYIWNNATMTLGEFKEDTYYDWFVIPSLLSDEQNGFNSWPKEFLTLADTDTVRVYPAAGSIQIIVVGGDVNPMMQGWSLRGSTTVSIDKWR